MKAEKLKRNFWHSSEIECMLNLIKEVKIEGSTATTHFTFVQIANKMKRRGFSNKSPTQIRRKWFQMKSAYLCYKKGNTERLMLIPEKFRTVMAQFVENDTFFTPYSPRVKSVIKPPPSPAPAPDPRPPSPKKIKVEPVKLEETLSDKFMARIKSHNAEMTKEFQSMMSSLMEYEHNCQEIRDNAFVKFLSLGAI